MTTKYAKDRPLPVKKRQDRSVTTATQPLVKRKPVLLKRAENWLQQLKQTAKKSLPAQLSPAEQANPVTSLLPYREYYMLYMLNVALPKMGVKNICDLGCKLDFYFYPEQQSRFTTAAEEALPKCLQQAQLSNCELFSPSFYITVFLSPLVSQHHVAGLIIDLKRQTVQYMEPTQNAIWSQAVLRALREQPSLQAFRIVTPPAECLVGLVSQLCPVYSLFYSVLYLLCDCSLEDFTAFLTRQRADLVGVLQGFTVHMWRALEKAGLLKLSLSEEKTLEYKKKIEELKQEGKISQLIKLQDQRRDMERRALALATGRKEKHKLYPTIIQAEQPYQDRPGDPAVVPVEDYRRTPVAFLNVLLQQSKNGCEWPDDMTDQEREEPYQNFWPYRAYYVKYMISKELPQLGYTQGCMSREPRFELLVVLDKEQGYSYNNRVTLSANFLPELQRLLQDQSCDLIPIDLYYADVRKPGVSRHHMSLLVQKSTKRLEFVEPNGTDDIPWIPGMLKALSGVFLEHGMYMDNKQYPPLLQGYTLVPPVESCPVRFQFAGYCAHYTILYHWLKIACANRCDQNAIPRALAQYSEQENLDIINAFTCHMWRVISKLGLLKSLRKLDSLEQELDRATRLQDQALLADVTASKQKVHDRAMILISKS